MSLALFLKSSTTATGLLAASANGRYLVDSMGNPFLLVGDSPQGLIAKLTVAEAQSYFANRAAHGFNAVWLHLLCGNAPVNFGGVNGATYDDITPFTSAGDISTPREEYFARVDAMLQAAADAGIVVLLNVAETIDWLTIFQDQGNTKCHNFGHYVGARYKDTPNIVWWYGNDFSNWLVEEDRILMQNIMQGVQDEDSVHLNVAMLTFLDTSTRMSAELTALSQLDCVYTYYPTYARCLVDYAMTPAMPLFHGEGNYEEENLRGYTTTPNVLRRQEYWALTSGACGVCYGNAWTWGFPANWADHYDSTGCSEILILKNFFTSLDWWLLVPDSAHAALTVGYGTYDDDGDTTNTNDYASCVLASDGSFLVAYLPDVRQVTIDMSKITTGENALCRWFDPTTGDYTTIGTYATSGTRNFTPSGTHADSTADWVLLIEAA